MDHLALLQSSLQFTPVHVNQVNLRSTKVQTNSRDYKTISLALQLKTTTLCLIFYL